MSLHALPRRTAPDVSANAVRQPLFGLRLLQRVRLDDDGGAFAIVIGRCRTKTFGLPFYLTLRLDTGARRWWPTFAVSPVGTPRLELVAVRP